MLGSYTNVKKEQNELIGSCKKHYKNLYCEELSLYKEFVLSKLRDKNTTLEEFRFYNDRFCTSLIEQALSLLPYTQATYSTRLSPDTNVPTVKLSDKICTISILRAGDALEHTIRTIVKDMVHGKILIQRANHSDDRDLFYAKLPEDIADRQILLVDPMLATGLTIQKAIDMLITEHNCKIEQIILISIVSVPVGLEYLLNLYPNLRIITGVIDKELNKFNYILPGLGDYGDLYFGNC